LFECLQALQKVQEWSWAALGERTNGHTITQNFVEREDIQ